MIGGELKMQHLQATIQIANTLTEVSQYENTDFPDPISQFIMDYSLLYL